MMQHIVLDTNSLIMAISSRSLYHKAWQAFLKGQYVLCVTNEIIDEYYEVIARNINPRVAEAIVYAILTRDNVKRLAPHFHFHLIQSAEDRHFNVLKTIPFPAVAVISIDEFARQWEDI